MATAGGLVIGAVGLGALYSTCVECYCVFHKIRAFDRDSGYLSSKWKTEGAILMRWGDRVGLLSGSRRDIDSQLYDPWTRKAVAEILFCIEVLLTDMEKLQTSYGLIPHGRIYEVVGAEGSNKRPGFPYARPHPQPSDNIRQGQKRVNILRKFHWSILDKEKFSDLIMELRDLVQRLNDLVRPTSDLADFRTASQRIPAIPGFDGDSERGYRPQPQYCEGDSRAFDVTRKQCESHSIMPPPSP